MFCLLSISSQHTFIYLKKKLHEDRGFVRPFHCWSPSTQNSDWHIEYVPGNTEYFWINKQKSKEHQYHLQKFLYYTCQISMQGHKCYTTWSHIFLCLKHFGLLINGKYLVIPTNKMEAGLCKRRSTKTSGFEKSDLNFSPNKFLSVSEFQFSHL